MSSVPVVVGLVAEGTTDLDFLKASIEATLTAIGCTRSVEFRDLQPEPDRTSGEHGDGGWPRVHQWCINHPPMARQSEFFQPLFAGQRTLDFLVVHLDGDVLDAYSAKVTSTNLPEEPWTADKRAKYVYAALNEWLWPDGTSAPDTHILAIMVQALESWLLAGYDTSMTNPEAVDPIEPLRAASPHLRPAKTSVSRLRKSRVKWQKMTKDVIGELPHIRSVCPSCERFLSDVESRIGEKTEGTAP